MDAATFLAEYARRVNEGSASGDLSEAALLRTEDARLVWRAPGMPVVEGRFSSAGEAIPSGATIAFSDVVAADDGTVTARITGAGFPPGSVAGTAVLTMDGDRIARMEVDLDAPVRRA